MSIKEHFVQILNYLMKNRNISKSQLARFIGISPQSIDKITKGNNFPTIENLVSIANFFNVSLDFLTGRSKLYEEPTGEIDYAFKDESGLLIGKFKYIFGVKISSDPNFNAKFLYLEELEGTFIKKILDSNSQFEFISLAYFLNNRLQLNYDAFRNNGIDIIIKENDVYQEIYIEYGGSSARLSLTNSYNSKYVEYWVSLPIEEKKKLLKESLYKDSEK